MDYLTAKTTPLGEVKTWFSELEHSLLKVFAADVKLQCFALGQCQTSPQCNNNSFALNLNRPELSRIFNLNGEKAQ